MDSALLQRLAAGNHWSLILPEIGLGCLALLLLALEIVLPARRQGVIAAVALAGQGLLLAALLLHVGPYTGGGEAFNGLLRHTAAGQVMRIFFLACSIFVCLLGRLSLEGRTTARTEYYHIVLVVTAALMLLVESNHFVMLFVALETVTIGLYILVGYFRGSAASLEAGLKYLILGALSSALLLFGIALLYGASGNLLLPAHTAEGMRFSELARFLAANPRNFTASIGIVLVLAGLAFKVGAFPFQIWIPDVYQGAPTPVTAFLAVASKAGGFVVLLILTTQVFSSYLWLVTPALVWMAGATILFGNLAALTQHNVKRLIGLSGVAHAGFMLLGVAAAPFAPLAVGALFFYLVAYLLASLAVFGVMAHVAGKEDSAQELDDYSGLARQRPFLALVLAIGLGSLAGIPPLAGFMGKFFVFVAAFQAGMRWPLALAAIGVVISIYYYFGWMRAAFFEPAPSEGKEPPRPVGLLAGLALGACALASVVLGFYQGPLGAWLSK